MLAVDPGNIKCGLAVVTSNIVVLNKRIIMFPDLPETVKELCGEYPVSVIIIGDRTNGKKVRAVLTALMQLPVVMVNEDRSSLEGRYRYLKENTRGLLKIIPVGLRVPREPYDDYTAVVLAERFFKKHPDFSPEKTDIFIG